MVLRRLLSTLFDFLVLWFLLVTYALVDLVVLLGAIVWLSDVASQRVLRVSLAELTHFVQIRFSNHLIHRSDDRFDLLPAFVNLY